MEIKMEQDLTSPLVTERSASRHILAGDARSDYWYRLYRRTDGTLAFHRDVPVVGRAVTSVDTETGETKPAIPIKIRARLTVDGKRYELGKDLMLYQVIPVVVE